MRRYKIFILVAGLLLYFCPVNPVCSEDFSGEHLQFCVDGGKIYFFQPETGRIFIYQTTTNRFSRMYTVEKLGADLKQSRSVPVSEEEN